MKRREFINSAGLRGAISLSNIGGRMDAASALPRLRRNSCGSRWMLS
jgi:hypothetical protein